MGNSTKRWVFTCLIALFGCDGAAEEEAMFLGAAGSPAFYPKPVAAADCPKVPAISGLQLDSCCQSNGMCGVDFSAWGRGCAPYAALLASGVTPPFTLQCSVSPVPTTAPTTVPASKAPPASNTPPARMTPPPPPPTMEPETTVYVEQSSQVLAGGGIELVYDFVLLFRDGWSTWRMGVNALEMPAADRAAKPESWVTWRRNDKGQPERLLKDKWTLVRGNEHKPSAPGRTLNGEYVYRQTFSGQSVARFLTFKSNGQIESSNFVGGTMATKQGTYRIDGFVLTLQWSDGTTGKHTLVIYPGDDMVLFNGTGYVR